MRNSGGGGAALLAALLAAPGAAAAADPVALLERAERAARSASFTGTVVRQAGDRMRALRIVQGVDGRGVHQRLVARSGERCEILRRGREAVVVYPDRRLVLRGRGEAAGLFPRLGASPAELAAQYRLRALGVEQVAGRGCRVVRVLPRDRYRYGCELCVDQASGLPLRLRLFAGPGREPVEEFVFTALTVLESMAQLGPDAFRLRSDIRDYRAAELPLGARPDAGRWRFEGLPPGYRLRRAIVRRDARAAPVHQLVVADAMTRVSVFVTERPGDAAAPAGFAPAGRPAYQTAVDGHQVVVVGAVPPEAMRMIGDALRMRR